MPRGKKKSNSSTSSPAAAGGVSGGGTALTPAASPAPTPTKPVVEAASPAGLSASSSSAPSPSGVPRDGRCTSILKDGKTTCPCVKFIPGKFKAAKCTDCAHALSNHPGGSVVVAEDARKSGVEEIVSEGLVKSRQSAFAVKADDSSPLSGRKKKSACSDAQVSSPASKAAPVSTADTPSDVPKVAIAGAKSKQAQPSSSTDGSLTLLHLLVAADGDRDKLSGQRSNNRHARHPRQPVEVSEPPAAVSIPLHSMNSLNRALENKQPDMGIIAAASRELLSKDGSGIFNPPRSVEAGDSSLAAAGASNPPSTSTSSSSSVKLFPPPAITAQKSETGAKATSPATSPRYGVPPLRLADVKSASSSSSSSSSATSSSTYPTRPVTAPVHSTSPLTTPGRSSESGLFAGISSLLDIFLEKPTPRSASFAVKSIVIGTPRQDLPVPTELFVF